jgi:quercetin dioxygenase-like cupin family protein
MSEAMAFQRLSGALFDEPFPGVRRYAASGERATLLRYTFEPGASFPSHHHPQEQITLVETGELEFTLDGETRRVGAGDVVVVPPDTPHGARACFEVPASLIAVLSPRRDDISAVSVVSP